MSHITAGGLSSSAPADAYGNTMMHTTGSSCIAIFAVSLSQSFPSVAQQPDIARAGVTTNRCDISEVGSSHVTGVEP